MDRDHLNLQDGYPQRLVGPAAGRLVALLIDDKSAVMGLWSCPAATGQPVDLFHPVFFRMDHGIMHPVKVNNMARAILGEAAQSLRFHQYMSLIYDSDMGPGLDGLYRSAREEIWGL